MRCPGSRPPTLFDVIPGQMQLQLQWPTAKAPKVPTAPETPTSSWEQPPQDLNGPNFLEDVSLHTQGHLALPSASHTFRFPSAVWVAVMLDLTSLPEGSQLPAPGLSIAPFASIPEQSAGIPVAPNRHSHRGPRGSPWSRVHCSLFPCGWGAGPQNRCGSDALHDSFLLQLRTAFILAVILLSVPGLELCSVDLYAKRDPKPADQLKRYVAALK